MRILLAVDGDKCSEKALHFVVDSLVKEGDEVMILSIAEVISPYVLDYMSGAAIAGMNDANEKRARKVLTDYGKLLSAKSITHRCFLGSGNVTESVCKEARHLNVDLIVIGRRKFSAIDRVLLESHSFNITHNAHCAVLIVKSTCSETSESALNVSEIPNNVVC